MLFEEIYPLVQSKQLLGPVKLRVLYDLATQVAALPGQIAEVGVYQGGTVLALAMAHPDKTVYAYDTFTGMPFGDRIDVHKTGEFDNCSAESLRVQAAEHGLVNVAIRPGIFASSAIHEKHKQFCFVHLDGDQYRSTRDGLAFFYPRMTPGGIIALDDYTWPYCPGVEQAVREFRAGHPVPLHRFSFSPHQAYIVKE